MRRRPSAPASADRRARFERLVGRVAPRACDDGDVDGVHDGFDDFDVFVVAQGRALAGRTDRNEAVDPGAFEALGVATEEFVVYAVARKGRGHRGVNPAER